MPTFKLNGPPVELAPQDRGAFAWLAGQVYRRLHEGTPLPAILLMFAHEGVTTQAIPSDDQRVQAILWTLWQLGIAEGRVEGEGEKRELKWEKGTHPDIDTRPVIEHFTEEGTRDGRALAASLVISHGRRIRVNGIEMPVRINDFELVKAQAAEVEKRRVAMGHPEPTLAAASYVAELLSQGADQNDLRLRAALEIAADMAVRAMVIDSATQQLRIEGFNEQAGLSGAFLSGAPVDQFQAAIERVQALNRSAEEIGRKLGQRAQSGGPGAERAAAIAPAAPQATEKSVPVQRVFKPRRR